MKTSAAANPHASAILAAIALCDASDIEATLYSLTQAAGLPSRQVRRALAAMEAEGAVTRSGVGPGGVCEVFAAA